MSEINGGNIRNPASMGVPSTPQRAQAVMSKIRAKMDTIKDLFATVQALIAELQAHRASKPERPNTAGMDSDDAKAVMAKYSQELDKWSTQLGQINDRLQSVQHRLHDAEAELGRLQGVELPTAEARDRDEMQRKVEQQQRALKQTAESFDTGKDDQVDDKQNVDSLVRRAEVRALVVKRQTVNGVKNFITLAIGQAQTEPQKDTKTALGSSVPVAPASGLPSE